MSIICGVDDYVFDVTIKFISVRQKLLRRPDGALKEIDSLLLSEGWFINTP